MILLKFINVTKTVYITNKCKISVLIKPDNHFFKKQISGENIQYIKHKKGLQK